MSLVASVTFIIQRVKNTDERGLGKRDKCGTTRRQSRKSAPT